MFISMWGAADLGCRWDEISPLRGAFVMVDSGSGGDDSGIPLMGVAWKPRAGAGAGPEAVEPLERSQGRLQPATNKGECGI